MATYNKRGYKAPKEKEVKEVTEEQQVVIDEKDSTTAGVFSKLDETASRTEDWVAKNQKYILWETTALGAKPGIISNDISNTNYWRISLKSK